MIIGLISSWNSRCGISAYSKKLVNGLIESGNEVKVAANYLKEKLEEDEPFVKRLFHVPFMTGETTADIIGIAEHLKECDIIHVQFETALYHGSYFFKILEVLRALNKKIVLTMHSSGMWGSSPLELIDFFITHEQMWCSNAIIPMGVKFSESKNVLYKNLLLSFGLGRNNDDLVKEALKDNNSVIFETCYGSHRWLPLDQLNKRIAEANALCLLYPPVGTEVSSSAVIQALESERPVIITNTNWFRHIINYPGIYIINDAQELKDVISYLFNSKNESEIENELKLRKERLLQDGRDYSTYINKHIEVYAKLLYK